eukprot:3920821-Pyramimonas_sp.AAC.2
MYRGHPSGTPIHTYGASHSRRRSHPHVHHDCLMRLPLPVRRQLSAGDLRAGLDRLRPRQPQHQN